MNTDTAIREQISREMPYIMSLAAVLENNPCLVCSDGIRAKLDKTLMLTRILNSRELDS
jgi:hypothetical protein